MFAFREDVDAPGACAPRTQDPKPSLTLTLFGPDPVRTDCAHFATGICQEMAVRLSQFKDFVVIGPVEPGKPPADSDSSASADESNNLHFTLEGSLRIHGDQLRLRVILRQTQSGSIVYAESHDARLDPEAILSLEDSLADRITSAIAGESGVLVRSIVERTHGRRVETLEDYEAAMLVYHWNTVMTGEAFTRAHQALENSVRRSPDNSRNMALLADIYAVDYFSHLGLVENNLQKALELAGRAMRISPGLQETRWVMGQVRFLTRELAESRREFEKAIELNPYNPNMLAVVGLFRAMMGDWEKGMSMTTEALQRNPHHPGWYPFVPALYHLRRKDYSSALKEAERLNTPGLLWAPAVRAAVYGYLGDTESSFKEKETLLALHPTFAEKPTGFVERLLHSDENIDLIMDGLGRCKFSPAASSASSASTLG